MKIAKVAGFGALAFSLLASALFFTEAVAEEFQKANPGARITVGISGTGGGFKKFNVGETDINDASRPIKAKGLHLENLFFMRTAAHVAAMLRALPACRWSWARQDWTTRPTSTSTGGLVRAASAFWPSAV